MGNSPEQLGTVKSRQRTQQEATMARLEKGHEGWREIWAFRFFLFLNSHHSSFSAPDFPRHHCQREADWFGSWLPAAAQGKGSWGQAECMATFSRAWRQGIAAGETLLHKENPKELENHPRRWQRWGSQENSCWRLRRQQPHQADFQKCQIPFPTELFPPDVHFLFQHSFHITLSFLTQQLPSWRTEMWDFARWWLWSLVLLLSCTEVKRNQDANKVRTIIAETAATVSPNPLSRQS